MLKKKSAARTSGQDKSRDGGQSLVARKNTLRRFLYRSTSRADAADLAWPRHCDSCGQRLL
jgi:hypothetical protein